MSREEFNKGFKLLKRFLKDEGLYTPVMGFLFKDGRPIKNLFEEFNSTEFADVDNWRVIFERWNLLTGFRIGINWQNKEYINLIYNNELSSKWRKYYEENVSY